MCIRDSLSPEYRQDEIQRKEAARALLDVLRPNDVVAGAVDGHFVICASKVTYPSPAMRLTERLSQALQDVGIAAQIGAAVHDGKAAPATLLRAAEAGAYEAAPNSVVYVEDLEAS